MERNSQKQLTDKEKETIKAINRLVYSYAIKYLNIVPYVISRDSMGHILLLEYKPNDLDFHSEPAFFCYMLGFDTVSSSLIPYCVGINQFKIVKQHYSDEFALNFIIEENCLNINKLSVHDAFKSLGISRLLLQTTENYAIENHLNSIKLKSLKCYTSIDGVETKRRVSQKKI